MALMVARKLMQITTIIYAKGEGILCLYNLTFRGQIRQFVLGYAISHL